MKLALMVAFAGVSAIFASCSTVGNNKSHGAIVLGDSSTIITETDSAYLRDYVADFHPKPFEEPKPDTAVAQQPAAETSAPAEKPAQQEPAQTTTATQGNGLNVDFDGVRVFIPNITTKSFGTPGKNSAAYQLNGGKIDGNQLKVSGGTVSRVNMRYQTSVLMENRNGDLVLENLNYTSGWDALKGGSNGYFITGLDASKLKYTEANNNKIRDAVQRALRKKNLSYKHQQPYLNESARLRNVKQKPLSVVLRNVVWQIEGKDASGKSFRKELRLDMQI